MVIVILGIITTSTSTSTAAAATWGIIWVGSRSIARLANSTLRIVPRRIRIPDRIIIHIRVPIPGLRTLRPGRDNGVGRSEPANRRVKPASAVKIQPKLGLFPLTRKFVVRAERAGGVARLAEGFVQRGGGLDSAGVRGHRRTAEVVSEQVGQRPVRADGETRRAREVILSRSRKRKMGMAENGIRQVE
jgi:hypothetical protein